MTQFRTLDQADVKGKRVLLRVDLNVPVENGKVTDATRIERVAPTITRSPTRAARSSCSRISADRRAAIRRNSLKPVAAEVARVIKRPVAFADDCVGATAEKAVAAMKPGDILCLENTRFHAEEEKNDPEFVAAARQARRHLRQRRIFGGAPRPCLDRGSGHELPAYAGLSMQAELEALSRRWSTRSDR